MIVRAIGLKEFVEPEVHTVRGFPGDIFLLCTDGLTDMVDDFSIRAVFEAYEDDLDAIVEHLVTMANDRGGRDNITALLVRIGADVSDELEDPDVASGEMESSSDRTVPGRPAHLSNDTEPEAEHLRPSDTQPALPLLMVVDDGLDAEPDVVEELDEESGDATLESFPPMMDEERTERDASPRLGVTLQIEDDD